MQKITIKTEGLLLTFELEKLTLKAISDLCGKHNIKSEDAEIINIEQEVKKKDSFERFKNLELKLKPFISAIQIVPKSYTTCELQYSISKLNNLNTNNYARINFW